MKQLFKIGAFSKLCRVSVRTLRHYEEQGLLNPYAVDPFTGYRTYHLCQAQDVGNILHLKRLGLSLEEIREVIERRDNRPDVELVEQKIKACEAQLLRLRAQLEELRELNQQLNEKRNMKEFQFKRIPARPVASYRRRIESYDVLGKYCVEIIGPAMMQAGCVCPEPQYCYTIEHDPEHRDHDIDIEYCEAVAEVMPDTDVLHFYVAPEIPRALCYAHYGPYTTFDEGMARVLKYVEEHHLQITGDIRFSYIDGPWNREDPAEWYTEVQVPVAE